MSKIKKRYFVGSEEFFFLEREGAVNYYENKSSSAIVLADSFTDEYICMIRICENNKLSVVGKTLMADYV